MDESAHHYAVTHRTQKGLGLRKVLVLVKVIQSRTTNFSSTQARANSALSRTYLGCVCVYYCRTYYKAVRGGGRRSGDDMCYDRRRAEACVDESARHALGPVRNPVLQHRVRLFSLVPLVWESNPKLQGGWCKTQPPGR